MIIKCTVCGKAKAKRGCKLNQNEIICSLCCASLRGADCDGCSYYKFAHKYSEQKKKKDGVKNFIFEINPELDETVDHALSMIERGRPKQAKSVIMNLYNEHPDYYQVIYARGVLHMATGEYDEALECFEKAIDIFPYFFEAHFNRATALMKKVDVESAINSFRFIIEHGDVENDLVHMAKSQVNNIEEIIRKTEGISIDLFLKAINIFNQACTHMDNREWQRAINCFNKVLEIKDEHCQTYGNIGICFGMLGEKDKALKYFDKALAIDADYEPAIINKKTLLNLQEGEVLNPNNFGNINYYKRKYLQYDGADKRNKSF